MKKYVFVLIAVGFIFITYQSPSLGHDPSSEWGGWPDVLLYDNDWIGLGAAKGRLEFDDQTTDEIIVKDAIFSIGDSAPQHLFSMYDSSPWFVMTDSDVNTITSSAAQAKDTNSVWIDCDDTTPEVGIAGGDGDVWGFTINTSDEAIFQNAAEYEFDQNIDIANGKVYEINNVQITSGALSDRSTIAMTDEAEKITADWIIGSTTGFFAVYDSDTEITADASTIDTAGVVIEADGVPSINIYGEDGDVVTTTINTDDEMVFSGSSADYDFDGNIDIASGKVYEINNTQITTAALSDEATIVKWADATTANAFTWHISAYDFVDGASYAASNGVAYPTDANSDMYAPVAIPFGIFGMTVVVDQITIYYTTSESDDDFDFELIAADNDGTITSLEDEDDIGASETGAQSKTCLAADLTLTDYALFIIIDQNNCDAGTDTGIYDIKFQCHLE